MKADLAILSVAGIAGVLLGACANPVLAQSRIRTDDHDAFVFPRLKYKTLTPVKDNWDAHPRGDQTFLSRLARDTNIKIATANWIERVIDIKELGWAYSHPGEEARIYSTPFLFMTGEGRFEFGREEVATLREYFKRGGFLFGDDCVANGGRGVGRGGDYFYKSFVKEMRKVFPGREMTALPYEHEIYHCFFDFPNGAPRMQGQIRPDMGLFFEDRLVAFVIAGDIHCGWTGFFPRAKKEASLEMGVNIVVYSLTH